MYNADYITFQIALNKLRYNLSNPVSTDRVAIPRVAYTEITQVVKRF